MMEQLYLTNGPLLSFFVLRYILETRPLDLQSKEEGRAYYVSMIWDIWINFAVAVDRACM